MRAIGVDSATARFRAGGVALGVQRARVRDNEAIAIGPTGEALGRTAGIMLSAPVREFEVQQNRIERDATLIEQEGVGDWAALVVQEVGELSANAGSFTTVNLQNGRAAVFGPAGEMFDRRSRSGRPWYRRPRIRAGQQPRFARPSAGSRNHGAALPLWRDRVQARLN